VPRCPGGHTVARALTFSLRAYAAERTRRGLRAPGLFEPRAGARDGNRADDAPHSPGAGSVPAWLDGHGPVGERFRYARVNRARDRPAHARHWQALRFPLLKPVTSYSGQFLISWLAPLYYPNLIDTSPRAQITEDVQQIDGGDRTFGKRLWREKAFGSSGSEKL
jgi:hypothetical protein